MTFLPDTIGLYTDFYELTMACGYFRKGRQNEQAVFDYFFRTNPFENGFTVFAGLRDFLGLLEQFRFSPSDLGFLREQRFPEDFLNYLSGFRFGGTICSMEEGEIIFPREPVVKVSGNLIETQLIESLLLNVLNFESLIATKAFRIRQVVGNRIFAEFGLRRAQGFGAMMASRASCIGGANSTSNVLASKMYGIPCSGTQAHSWIQSFGNELEAFRAYAEIHGDNSIFLVDTYDTLRSGVPNAIRVAKEMKSAGQKLKGIRLDSGDLAYLSKKARKMLDEAGLHDVLIVASNQLNEHVIKSLLTEQDAPIDVFGVGTELVSGKPDGALDGVYKLVEIAGEPKMKISDNPEKITLPGNKKVIRFYDNEGLFYRDGIFLQDEALTEDTMLYHPYYPEKYTTVAGLKSEELLQPVFQNGKSQLPEKSPSMIYEFLKKRIALLPVEHQRFVRPHIYKTGISQELMLLNYELMQKARETNLS
jgi:nicotinate phosphoribosyltransferase